MRHQPPVETEIVAPSPARKRGLRSVHPLYRKYILWHIVLTLCGALGANIRYGPGRPEALQLIAGLFLVVTSLCVYVVPLIDAVAFFALTGQRLRHLPYLLFDLVLWYFQLLSILREVQ